MVSSLQFSYWLGQAGIVHIGLDQRVLTVDSEIREKNISLYMYNDRGWALCRAPATAAAGAIGAARPRSDASIIIMIVIIRSRSSSSSSSSSSFIINTITITTFILLLL